jgi:hypothetical protein
MSEESSTLGIPFRWAAKKDTRDEGLSTGYFLFKGEVGRVGLRGCTEKRGTILEGHVAMADGTTVLASEKDSSPTKLNRVPQTRLLHGQLDQRYILLKKYEGFITARDGESFSARLFENSSDYPVVEAEFDLEELSETDRELAVEGAPLVWTIGYAYQGSTRKRESVIYLRRLEAWSDQELEKGRSAANDLTSAVQWE